MAYSTDLRERVVSAYENQEGTQHELALRFKISVSTVQNWVKLKRETHRIHKRPHGGGASVRIAPEGQHFIRSLLTQQTDMTLDELSKRYERQYNEKVSTSTMHDTLKRMGIIRKRKVTTTFAKKQR